MDERQCRTCRWWQLTGIPINHPEIEDCDGLCEAPLPLPVAWRAHELPPREIQAGACDCECWTARREARP